MHTLEIPVDIDQNHQIHLQLPATITARKAKVIVMVEEDSPPRTAKLFKFGLFAGQIDIADDFDAPLPDSFWLEGQL